MQINKELSEMVKQIMVLMILLGGLLLSGCDRQKQSQSSPPVPEVAVVTAQPQKVVLTTELPGRTSSYLVAEIRPQVSGLIQKRLFREGSDVNAGQALFQIDPSPFQAALDNARAALSRSEANLSAIRLRAERLKELVADKAVSQQDFDDATAVLKHTEADIRYWKAMVDTAHINLKYTSVTAPISGRIGRSDVTEGALVTAHQPMALATIQQLDPIYVDVPQSTTELLRLKQRAGKGGLITDGEGQRKVKLLLEDGTTYPFEGTLQFRDVTVEPTSGSVVLRMVFPNPRHILLPGMFVRAVVREGIAEKAVLVPQEGVSRDPKGNPIGLIVDGEGKVQQRMLTLDRAIGNRWLVSSGLIPGDRLIVEGLQKVRPGATVRVVPFEAGSEKNGGGRRKATRPTAQ